MGGTSPLFLSLVAAGERHSLTERARSGCPMLSVGVYPDRVGESVGPLTFFFLLSYQIRRSPNPSNITSLLRMGRFSPCASAMTMRSNGSRLDPARSPA